MSESRIVDNIRGYLESPSVRVPIREQLSRDHTAAHYTAILQSVEYRGWRFAVVADAAGHYLQVQFPAANAHKTGVVVPQHGRKWRLSPHMTRSEIVQTALAAVLAAVEHEAREEFRYHGVAIFGPHHDVDALVELVQSGASDVRS